MFQILPENGKHFAEVRILRFVHIHKTNLLYLLDKTNVFKSHGLFVYWVAKYERKCFETLNKILVILATGEQGTMIRYLCLYRHNGSYFFIFFRRSNRSYRTLFLK